MSTPTYSVRHIFGVALILALLVVAPASAATPAKSTAKTTTNSKSSSSSDSNNISTAVTQSYNADKTVQVSMIVELKAKDPTTVVPLEYDDIRHMLGVVVPANNASIVLTPAKITQQQVLVATSGRFYVLVSNQQGPVKVGDALTISALSGVGMKASENESQVIGKAAGAFTGTANVIGSVKLKDSIGRTTSIALGRIPVDINISHNPLSTKSSDYVPGFLAKAATGIANKPVSAARIYLGCILMFATSLITGNMLYSGVRSGMIAVGRNPLSKKSIMRSLIQTVIAGLIIFVAGVFAVYLLLKL